MVESFDGAPDPGGVGNDGRLRQVLDGMGEGFVLLSPDLVVLDINAEGQRIDGRPRTEIVGRSLLELSPEARDLPTYPAYVRALAEQQPQTVEYRHLTDDHDVWLEVRAYPVPEGLAVFYRDVTPRKLAESAADEARAKADELAAEQAAILGQLGEGVIVADADGRITFVNDAAERLHGVKLLGVGPEHYTERYHLLTLDGEPHPVDALPLARAVTRGETVTDARWRIRRPDGTEVLAIGSAQPVRLPDGRAGGAILTIRDDTERHAAEQATRESELRFRNMADHAPVMMWVTDPSGYCTYLNRAWYEYTGQSEAEAEGFGWLDATHPDDREMAEKTFLDANAAQAPFRVEYRLRCAAGNYCWCIDAAAPRFDAAGAFLGYVGSVIDIDERAAIEARLRASEAHLSALVGQATAGVAETDLTGRFVSVNDRYCTLLGRSRAELLTMRMQDLTHPDDLLGNVDLFTRMIETGEAFEIEKRYVRPDGTPLWVNNNVTLVRNGDERSVLAVSIDIGGRKAAERALRESEDRLRLAVDATQIGTWDFDPIGGALSWDDRVLAAFGLPPDTPVDYDLFLAGLHPDDRDKTDAEVQRALDPQGTGTFDIEYRTIGLGDGKERWIAARGRAFFEGERAARFVGTTVDITSRKAAEAALEQSSAELLEQAQTLETLNRSATELARELDHQRIVQMVTDSGVALTGAQFGAFFYNVTNEAGESYMLYALSGARPDQFDFGMPRNTAVFHVTFSGEGVVRVPDITKDPRYGTMAPHFGMPQGHLPVRSYLAVPVISAAGEVIGGLLFGHEEPDRFDERHETLIIGIAAQAAIAMDNARLYEAAQKELASRVRAELDLRTLNETLEHRVAEELERRVEVEEALRQAQKMETLGQLTGGVAHDFNNLLQIVSGNIDLIHRNLPADNAKLRRAADNAARGAERAAVLTQRLLAFSRRQPLAPKPIDPNRLVGGMTDLLHRTLGETVQVETVLSPGLWPVEVDPHQLENALLNLAINARDAMMGGGKLTIETCNTHLDRAYVTTVAEVVPGQYVCISVTDSGAGMDAQTVARAFEPFFTTKEVGKGTGLGLSMVYGFVKQSGGHLKIYSEPGEGTTVKIYLPRLVGDRPEVETEVDGLVPEGGQSETILVCEDDEDVRAYTVEVLRELGYRVIEAGDGPAAIRLLEREEEHVDLLFTDVVLPGGMTGAVLADRARKLRPELKVLFTTGYARNAIVHHGRLDPGVELITKPFSYADLAARVRDMLDGMAKP